MYVYISADPFGGGAQKLCSLARFLCPSQLRLLILTQDSRSCALHADLRTAALVRLEIGRLFLIEPSRIQWGSMQE